MIINLKRPLRMPNTATLMNQGLKCFAHGQKRYIFTLVLKMTYVFSDHSLVALIRVLYRLLITCYNPLNPAVATTTMSHS